MPDIVERLGQVPLFAALGEESKARVAAIVKRTHVPRGATIVRQGQVGKTMFIVDSGEVVALALDERGEQTPPRFLHEGDAWGETSLLIGEPRDATMKVQEDVELLYIQKSDFDRLLKEHPHIEGELTMRADVRIKLEAPRFSWLGPDERVEWFGHKHWIVFARNMVVTSVLWLFAVVALALFAQSLATWQMAAVALGLLALTSPWIVWSYVDWRNDFHVITDRRLVHVEKILLQYESRIEAPLDKVQNTSLNQGPLGSILGFAQMRIATAGAVTGHVDFDWVTQPELVEMVLVEQMRRFRLHERSREYEEIKQVLDERLNHSGEGEMPLPAPPEVQPTPPPPKPRRDPLSLLNRGKGCSRIIVDTGLFSFFLRPHLPRLGIIIEGRSIIWRRHWIILFREVLPPLILAVFFLALAIASFFLRIAWLPPSAGVTLGLVLGALCFLWLVYAYEDWRNDLYVVTEQHIIDIERTPFLAYETRRQANLENIQDIHYEMPGLWASIIKQGDVVIETAGQGQFTFTSVFDPSGVQREIFDRVEGLRQRRQAADRRQREAELAQWFEIYHQDQGKRRPPPSDAP